MDTGQADQVDVSFSPPWIRGFRDNPRIEGHIGPAGTGKTYSAAKKVSLISMQQPAIRGIRKAVCLVIRDTYSNLVESTIKTVEEAMIGYAPKSATGLRPKTRCVIPVPDGTVLHLTFEYLAIDRATSVKKLLEGRLCTHAIIDEACTAPKAVLDGVINRLGRYPSKQEGGAHNPTIFLTTNGGYEDNWFNDICLGKYDKEYADLTKRMGRLYCRIYWDEPGLLAPEDPKDFKDITKWRENPKAQNIENLPGGYDYYWQMLSNLQDHPENVILYVQGGFAPRVMGRVVFTEFSKSRHVIPEEEFELASGASIGLSFDFGRTPVCLLWTQLTSGRLVVFDEFAIENGSVRELMWQKVQPALTEKYGFANIDWATGDPAGASKDQGIGTSPYEILMAPPFNLPMEVPGMNNQIEGRLEPFRAVLTQLGHNGDPMFGVTSNCKLLINALGKTYIYEKKRGYDNELKEIPTKSHEQWCSDIADAAQYGVLYKTIQKRSNMASNRAKLAMQQAGWR